MLLGSPCLTSHSPGLSLEPLNNEFAKVVRHIIARSLRMGSKRRKNVTRENTASLNYPCPSKDKKLTWLWTYGYLLRRFVPGLETLDDA